MQSWAKSDRVTILFHRRPLPFLHLIWFFKWFKTLNLLQCYGNNMHTILVIFTSSDIRQFEFLTFCLFVLCIFDQLCIKNSWSNSKSVCFLNDSWKPASLHLTWRYKWRSLTTNITEIAVSQKMNCVSTMWEWGTSETWVDSCPGCPQCLTTNSV